uniref:kxDL motif-containing protein 1 n=1 Tax=Myxine glutinosa TaxID=7769 RepID=UPI00358E07F9
METAAEHVTANLLGMVNEDDIGAVVNAQRQMLGRFEKTNEMLINFNALSASRFPIMSERFQQHTHALTELKRDLDTIFRRIRNLQRKLERQHPQAFQAQTVHSDPESSAHGTEARDEDGGEGLSCSVDS